MTEREKERKRLIEILKEDPCDKLMTEGGCSGCPYEHLGIEGCFEERFADYLLSSGVTVIPCDSCACKLLEERDSARAEVERQEAEIERLNYILQCYALEYGTVGDKERILRVARAEAYKELTKMLKSKCEYSDYYETYIISLNDIDYYAKKFTEGKADEH